MFERFTMAQRLRNYISNLKLPKFLEPLIHAWKAIYAEARHTRGTLASDIIAWDFTEGESSETVTWLPADTVKLEKPLVRMFRAKMLTMHSHDTGLRGRAPLKIYRRSKIVRRGLAFTTCKTSLCDSNIICGQSIKNGWYAGRIHDIFSYATTKSNGEPLVETFVLVKRFRELSEEDAAIDQYRKWIIAGGRVCYATTLEPSKLEDLTSRELDEYVLLTPKDILCHFAATSQVYEQKIKAPHVHVLPIDRVSESHAGVYVKS